MQKCNIRSPPPPPPNSLLVYGSVAFTINHVSASVSLSLSLTPTPFLCGLFVSILLLYFFTAQIHQRWGRAVWSSGVGQWWAAVPSARPTLHRDGTSVSGSRKQGWILLCITLTFTTQYALLLFYLNPYIYLLTFLPYQCT